MDTTELYEQKEAARIIQAITEGNPSLLIVLVDALIAHAHAAGASDMHVLPGRTRIAIRFRIDGALIEAHSLPLAVHAEFIARLKILANIRTDEHHAAQDGRFRFSSNALSIDIRISLAPTFYGENAVLRLLSLDAHARSLEDLAFSPAHSALLRSALCASGGLILATGPTGSGKTTTLYALLSELASQQIAIIIIEDPIEYSIDGVSQMQVQARTGFTFAHGLRSIVRQDPDVIMVGEIRDTETARLACTAALTGHLVLSTLHTNSARAALIRLQDLGVEPYLIDSSLSLVVGQRLVRSICTQCVTRAELSESEKALLEGIAAECGRRIAASTPFFRGAGCSACTGTGYRGRIAIHEMLETDDAAQAEQQSLLADALEKTLAGNITFEELARLKKR